MSESQGSAGTFASDTTYVPIPAFDGTMTERTCFPVTVGRVIVERFSDGEGVASLAAAYACTTADIEHVIRWGMQG